MEESCRTDTVSSAEFNEAKPMSQIWKNDILGSFEIKSVGWGMSWVIFRKFILGWFSKIRVEKPKFVSRGVDHVGWTEESTQVRSKNGLCHLQCTNATSPSSTFHLLHFFANDYN